MIGMKKVVYGLFGLLLLFQLVAAVDSTSGISAVSSALYTLCNGIKGLIPIASMLMIVLAGIIYAGGQMMGAETRARANVWATACLTGAIIGLIIVLIAPGILGMLYPTAQTGSIC